MRSAARLLRHRLAPRRFSSLGDHFFGADGALLRSPPAVDYFALLGVPHGVDADEAALDEARRVLQRRLHPDRFATADEGQKDAAEAASALVNDALTTLRDPLRRADYALALATGAPRVLDDETKTAPPALLMEVMEAREAVDDAEDAAALARLLEANEARVAAATSELREAFAAEDFEKASDLVVRLNFYGKIRLEATEKAHERQWDVR